jgi:hypothetical protein
MHTISYYKWGRRMLMKEVVFKFLSLSSRNKFIRKLQKCGMSEKNKTYHGDPSS